MAKEPSLSVQPVLECEGGMTAIADALYVIGGKWNIPIIMALGRGPMRFSEPRRAVLGISPRVLSKELKELEFNGFLKRTDFQKIPAVVEYELLPYSYTIEKVVSSLSEWGLAHRKRMMVHHDEPAMSRNAERK
jgi:DNA-binding HxlR family transcriptional regulator